MKRIDPTFMADLIGAVIGQCKADISRYLRKGKGVDDAMEAIRFIMGKDFEQYLYSMGMPEQDFDKYRRAILNDSINSAKKEKGVRRSVA